MSKIFYEVIEYDRHNNPKVLATGLTKDVCEEGLRYDGVEYSQVRWINTPTYDMRADTEVYRGVLVR